MQAETEGAAAAAAVPPPSDPNHVSHDHSLCTTIPRPWARAQAWGSLWAVVPRCVQGLSRRRVQAVAHGEGSGGVASAPFCRLCSQVGSGAPATRRRQTLGGAHLMALALLVILRSAQSQRVSVPEG